MYPENLLIVDDDALIRWALQREFLSLNIQARIAGTAAGALAELRGNSFDLVFLDIHLPDGNGIELLGEIRKTSPEVKVVIMCSDGSCNNRQSALAGGAFQFLEKPFEREEIHSVLRSACGAFPQRRKHPRFLCRIPLRLSIVEPAPDEADCDLDNLRGTLADIGAGGLMLRTEYPLREGQNVRTYVADGYEPIPDLLPSPATATVVWVAPAQDFITAGLKFLN